MARSPQVDAYIAKAPPFAKPILSRIRAAFHKACPKVEETLKWGVPHFGYKGNLGLMAAFKQHASFGFWRQRELGDPNRIFEGGRGMGGRKYLDAAELPAEGVLVRYVKEAVKLNEAGKWKRPVVKKPPVKVPADLEAALRRNARARAAFDGFPPSHRREYVEWIVEAKRPETRAKRIATALSWIAQDKSLNWKYR